ncbi:MAG: retropepsin-like domain-containing protein [Spirochaetaceae bacterium]|nr:retropepsin-like domain-containing protein [Spirochaetaceae bacterium]
MAIPKHLTLSYYFAKKQKKIITPVNLYSVQLNSAPFLSIDAIWDTGASMSVVTPEIKDKLKLTPIDKKTIAGVHSTQVVDIVFITLELPNNVIKKNIEAAVCNIPSNAGMILGMDIISLGDFALSHGSDQTFLSFAVPPFQEKTDFSKRQYEP